MSGLTLIVVPTIQYGGYFLLNVLSGKYDGLGLTAFQKSMFRAGHAHAGVLILLSLVAQILIDQAGLSRRLGWAARIGFPLSAVLVSGGFFFAAMGSGLERPNDFLAILYVGIFTLAASLIVTGVGLIRSGK